MSLQSGHILFYFSWIACLEESKRAIFELCWRPGHVFNHTRPKSWTSRGNPEAPDPSNPGLSSPARLQHSPQHSGGQHSTRCDDKPSRRVVRYLTAALCCGGKMDLLWGLTALLAPPLYINHSFIKLIMMMQVQWSVRYSAWIWISSQANSR